MMTAELLARLAAEGHDVRLYADHVAPGIRQGRQPTGVTVLGRSRWQEDRRRWHPAVVVAHPDHGPVGFLFARRASARYVAVVHNDGDATRWGLRQHPPDLTVWNAEATREALGGAGGIVVRSPLRVADHAAHRRGDAVTLVNLNPKKGPDLFYRVGEGLRSKAPLLAVRGGYGAQITPPVGSRATVVGPFAAADMRRRVWARTRVLTVPSTAESWGRVAAEALCSGIPVVAAPTPGLRECLGEAGTFVPLADERGWRDAIDALLSDPAVYRAASRAARARAQELETLTQRDTERFVGAIVGGAWLPA